MPGTREFDEYFQERLVIRVALSADAGGGGAGSAYTGPVVSTCTLTADTNANMADSDTVTLNSGISKKTYEYDKSANGVTAGNVSVTAGTTAATVAANFRTAILATQPELAVVDNGNGTLTISQRWPGVAGNNTNSKSSASALAITNFAAGADGVAGAVPSSGISATTTKQVWKAENRAFRVDRAYYVNPTGFAADAANYWQIQVLTDTAVVGAQWSTLSTAEGALTANVPVDLTLSGTDANCVVLDTKNLAVKAVKNGSPAALPPGDLVIEGRYV